MRSPIHRANPTNSAQLDRMSQDSYIHPSEIPSLSFAERSSFLRRYLIRYSTRRDTNTGTYRSNQSLDRSPSPKERARRAHFRFCLPNRSSSTSHRHRETKDRKRPSALARHLRRDETRVEAVGTVMKEEEKEEEKAEKEAEKGLSKYF
jgi:hypothetical protein